MGTIRPAWVGLFKQGDANVVNAQNDDGRPLSRQASRTDSVIRSAGRCAGLTPSAITPAGRKMTPPAVTSRDSPTATGCSDPGMEYGADAAARAVKTSPTSGRRTTDPAST